ncbi:MAG: transporter substrate-binding domain-containing protein [Marinobacter sp.]|uniref:transporter substrate-binding domain-containing protein n=1 Tax=Marinobacter sp. TaxID=50741 RepID=UPI00329A4589
MQLRSMLSVLLFITVAPFNLAADPEREVLRLAAIGDVPSTDLAIQLLDAAYGQLGIEVTAVVVPSRRALLIANNGKVDGDLFRIEDPGSRAPNLIKVPYPLMEGRLLAVARGSGQITEQEGSPRRVAVRRGVVIAEKTAKQLGMTPVVANSYAQMHSLLERGRVDMALVSEIEGYSPLNEEDWSTFNILSEPVARFTLHHYLHRRHADLVEPLAETLQRQDASGDKNRILERARQN